MKKINWRATATLVFSSIVAATLVTVPTVATLTNENQDSKLVTQTQSNNFKSVLNNNFAKSLIDSAHTGVQGQILYFNFRILYTIKAFAIKDTETNQVIVAGNTTNNGWISFGIRMPFNQTQLKTTLLLFNSQFHSIPQDVSTINTSGATISMKNFDFTILQPDLREPANITSTLNSKTKVLSISSTVPDVINAPYHEKPHYYWEDVTNDKILIPAQLSNDGKTLLFPQNEISKSYGKSYCLIEKYDNYQKTIIASDSTISLAKHVDTIQPLSIKNGKDKEQKTPIKVETFDSLIGVQGQTLVLPINVTGVLEDNANISFKIANSNGMNENFESVVTKNKNNKLIVTLDLPFNETQEIYTLQTSFANQTYKSKIVADVLVPQASKLQTPKLVLATDKIKEVSVQPSSIINGPLNETPSYYWQNNDEHKTLEAIKNGDSYTIPESEIQSALNKSWQLMAKYKNVDKPIAVSNAILVSHDFKKPIVPQKHSESKWWIIPVVFAIVGAATLAIGLVWYAKKRKDKLN